MIADRPSPTIVGEPIQGSPDALQPTPGVAACAGLRQPAACCLEVGQGSFGEPDGSQPDSGRQATSVLVPV